MLNTVKSEELYKVALDLMPGGVNSPVRAFGAVGRNPLFIDHAKGSYVYDVDGNKFIDYVCSWGPGILGHSHPEVLEEVVKACFDGLTFGAPTGKENELAQLVKDCVPSMEMMRMVSSGTEATMSAIRAARGFTGRDKIIKFKGCYAQLPPPFFLVCDLSTLQPEIWFLSIKKRPMFFHSPVYYIIKEAARQAITCRHSPPLLYYRYTGHLVQAGTRFCPRLVFHIIRTYNDAKKQSETFTHRFLSHLPPGFR